MSAYAQPGYVSGDSMMASGAGGLTSASWSIGVANNLATAIVDQYRKTGSVGMPATWVGAIDPIDIQADGFVSPLLWSRITDYANSDAAANDRDFITSFVRVEKPASQQGDWVPSAAKTASDLAAARFGLSLREQQFAEAKFAISMMDSQSSGGGGSSRSSGGSSSRSSGGGGGSGGGGSSGGADYAGRLGYEQSSNAMSLEFQQQKNQMELAYLTQKYALANDPNNPEYALKREEMAQRGAMQSQELAQRQQMNDQNIAYQTQRDQRVEQLGRAETIAKLGANPGDAVQREMFLRTGREPVGTAMNVWTGEASGGEPTTLSQMYASMSAGGVFGANPTLPAGTPSSVPYNTDPNAPTPVTPAVPQYARGTEITPDGWTRAPEFIAGDPQRPGVVNPEHIKLRVQNGEAQAKVTPMNGPNYGQAREHANPNARFMRGPQYHRMPGGRPMAGPPMFARGTGFVGTSSATQADIDQAQNYYATVGNPDPERSGLNLDYFTNNTPAQIADFPWRASSTYQGMSGTDIIQNGNSPYYGQTAAEAYQRSVAPKNTNATFYSPSGKATPGYDTNMMSQEERTAYNTGGLTPDRNETGATQSLYPSMANYKPPADWPTAPPPPVTATAATAPTVPTVAGTQPAAAPTAPAPQAAPVGTVLVNGEYVPEGNGIRPTSGLPWNVRPDSKGGFVYINQTTGASTPVDREGRPLGPETGGTAPADPAVTAAPGTPPASITSTGSTTVFKGTTLLAPKFATSDASGNTRVTSPGYVTTPDGGGYYFLMGDGSEVKRPDGSYIFYDQVKKQYMPVVASPTIISSEAQFRQLPHNIQQDILQGKPTGYVLNNNGIDTHIAAKMISDERNRLAQERGVAPSAVPQQLLDMYANQFFGGLEAGRIYPGGWVSMMSSGYGSQNSQLSPEEFGALSVADQRALIEGNAGPQYANNIASSGTYNPGSRSERATTGPLGGMATGLGVLGPSTSTSESYDYGKYVNEQNARSIFPEMFQVSPAAITPTVPASPAVSGGPSAGSQPPGAAPAGYHWVWRG